MYKYLSLLFAVSLFHLAACTIDFDASTCASNIYPINIYTTIQPGYPIWRLGLIGSYPQETSAQASLIRFAVDYINLNTSILPNISLELHEADTLGNSQSTQIASVAEIMIDGVRGFVGGDSAITMSSCAQASTDFSTPHVGTAVQTLTFSTKATYPYMLRAIPAFKEQARVLYQLLVSLNWYRATILATGDEYGVDAGNYMLGDADLKAVGVKFTQQAFNSRNDFLTRARNLVTAMQTVKINIMFTTPTLGFPFLDYVRHNATENLVGNGIVYILGQAMCKPILEGDNTWAQYYPLLDGSICIYPRGGDNDSSLYRTMSKAWQTANETVYPGARNPSSFDWYGVDGVFSHAYALKSLIAQGRTVYNINGTAYLKALNTAQFNGTTGPFAYDTTYDRRGIWDIYNNVWDKDTQTLVTHKIGTYNWQHSEWTNTSTIFFFGGSSEIPPANVTKPPTNTTAAPTQPPPTAAPIPPSFRPYNPQLAGGLGFFVGLCALVAIGAALVLALRWDYFANHGPFYSALILVGVVMSYAAAATVLPEPTDTLCLAFPWLLGLAFNLVYGCLFIKTWVLYGVFRKAAQLKKTSMTPFDILRLIGIFIVVECILLIVWTVQDPPTVHRVDFADHTYSYQCSNSNVFWAIFLAYKGGWLIFGAILAFLTRNIVSEYNESKSIAAAIYADIALVVIAIPLALSIQDSEGGLAIVEVVVICLSFTFTMIVLFWTVWKNIFFYSEPEEDPTQPNKMSTFSVSSSPHSTPHGSPQASPKMSARTAEERRQSGVDSVYLA